MANPIAEPKKNTVHIKNATDLRNKVAEVRKEISGKFNNRECALAITKLQEAEHWLNAYATSLKED